MAGSRIGVMFRRHLPPERLAGFARRVEDEGFEELWVVEDCFWAGGMTAATAALAATDRLTVGLGIAPVVARNPAIAAMEVGGLARMFPGRLIAGLGHGVKGWMGQIGALPHSQLAALEETVVAVRRLLAGERVSVRGRHVLLDDVALVFPPDVVPPVVCGVTGPKSLELTGRAAEGALLPEGSSPAYVRAAVERMGNPAATCAVYVVFAVSDDPLEAQTAARESLGGFARGGRDERLAQLGIFEEVPDADVVRRYAVAGTPDDCAAAIRALERAGAQSIVLVPAGHDIEAQLTRAAREVLPLIA
jgi:5,10-methylenetetrahydromethanopterin reductase